MAKISTALLISDDLDDHQAITEAFQKVKPSVVVIAVLSQEKALELLSSKKLIPDYVFLDLTSPDSNVQRLLANLRTVEDGTKISLTVYGDSDDPLQERWTDLTYFDKEYEFPELVEFCRKLISIHNS